MNTLPVKHNLTLAARVSLVIAALTAVVSIAGLLLGITGLYGADPKLAIAPTEAEAGLLLPGLLGQDVFNLFVGMPLLLGTIWLARRGSLIGLLLWPGMLFYALYWYLLYLVGAPFSLLFLLYILLVTLSAYVIIGLLAIIDGEQVQRQLDDVVPARAVGGLLVILALLTLAQDGSGAFITALVGNQAINPAARPVWIADLALQAPAVLIGGVLLWRRHPLGYVAGAGLLFQYGLSAVGFVVCMALQAILTASRIDAVASVVLLVFGVVCFVPLAFFMRGAANHERPAAPPIVGVHG